MPNALRDAGAQVEVHADHFADDAPDQEWLTEAGVRGWVVITKDKAIRHRETEIEALKRARVAAFVLTAKGLSGPENGAVLARALNGIGRFLVGNRPPFVAAISAGARITMLYRGHKPRARSRRKR